MTWEERLENLRGTVGPKEDVERIRKYIEGHEWKFAKSYADFCPHEYTLRRSWENDNEYAELVHHIWIYGIDAAYGKQGLKRYWFDHEGGYYYFLYPGDTDDDGNCAESSTIINRGKIKHFEFWVEEDLLGQIVRCKVKPGAPRREKEERGMIEKTEDMTDENRR